MELDSGYTVGQVAGLLKSKEKVSEEKGSKERGSEKKSNREKELKKLASLFTVREKPKNLKKKSKKETLSLKPVVQVPLSEQEGYSPPPGIVHESLLTSGDSQKVGKKRKADSDKNKDDFEPADKRPRRDRRDRTRDSRTVFVGNLPNNVTKKAVKKFFKSAGAIESVRLRCAAPADLKVSKKVAIIKQEFHPERHNIAAFVVYKEAEGAAGATKLNGEIMEGHHIRVDLASKERQHDHGRSVFVGNLPFDIEEEAVWSHFEECGEVENVRLIRDRHTSIGKGFGYVLFKNKSSVSLALKFGKRELKGRKLRIQHSTENPTKPVKTTKDVEEKAKPRPKFKTPSNQTSSSFQGDKAKQTQKMKEKKKKLLKKKKTRLEHFKAKENVQGTGPIKGVKQKLTRADKRKSKGKKTTGSSLNIKGKKSNRKDISSSRKRHQHVKFNQTKAKQKTKK